MEKGFVIMSRKFEIGDVWATHTDDIEPKMIIRNKEDLGKAIETFNEEYVKKLFDKDVVRDIEVSECSKGQMLRHWVDCDRVFYVRKMGTGEEFNVVIYTEEVDMI